MDVGSISNDVSIRIFGKRFSSPGEIQLLVEVGQQFPTQNQTQNSLVEIHGTRALLLPRSTINGVFFDFASVVTLATTRALRIVLYDYSGHCGYPEALPDSN